jgi:kumamolisin
VLQMRAEFRPDDFDQCMKAQNLSPARPIVKRVDDAALTHEIETAKDFEIALDTQIVASLAPGARIVIYEAPNDERGLLDAVRTAIFDTEQRPSILSISYGWPEYLWTPAALDILDELFVVAALLGVTVFCSSGDNGAELEYDGKPHVLAPASNPFVHACGGTSVDPTHDESESVWPNSGGGFSERFGAPSWQTGVADIATKLSIPVARGVPDVAAQTLPGYYVVLNGVELAAGGTSAIAPVWSSLTARLNQRLGKPAGFFGPLLYQHQAQSFRDVVDGNNGYYQAGAGWNPCTGLGVPVGTAVESALRGADG